MLTRQQRHLAKLQAAMLSVEGLRQLAEDIDHQIRTNQGPRHTSWLEDQIERIDIIRQAIAVKVGEVISLEERRARHG
jgi:hypothetical protein